VEEGVGRILRTLEKSGQLDRTIFVFTSDEGYFYGEHGLSFERRLAYEESARIPLLMRYPALIRAGITVDAIALNLDLAPTLLEIAGAEPLSNVQGRSLVPGAEGRAQRLAAVILDRMFHRQGFSARRQHGLQMPAHSKVEIYPLP